MSADDKLLTAAELAEYLRLSRSWVYDHTPRRNEKTARKRPELPVVWCGARARYRRSHIETWMERMERLGQQLA